MQREQQQLVADFRRYQVDSEISLREAHSEVKELRTELNQLHAQELVATPAVDGSTAEMEATPIAGARGGGGGGILAGTAGSRGSGGGGSGAVGPDGVGTAATENTGSGGGAGSKTGGAGGSGIVIVRYKI